MSYVDLCKLDDLNEGKWAAFTLEDQDILVVWPEDGEPKAYNGICPHQASPLKYGQFDGKLIICPAHQWVFDANSGQAVHPRGCQLEVYPLRIDNDKVLIEIHP